MFTQISTEAARELIRKKSPIILDIRDATAYSDARIPNAIHVTLSTLRTTFKLGRDAPLLIYCYRGYASRDFAELFSDFGFREVYSLEGGFQAWHAANAEIERPVASSARVNSDPAIDWILDEGGNPDDPNALLADGFPPLIKACQQGRAEIVKRLIEAGADLGGTDAHGNDALWAACHNGDLRTIDTLLKAGIDLNRQNRTGATPLIYAASAGKLEVVEFLLKAGADPELRTESGHTALELAANLDILRRLRYATARA
jgi:thiosulfate/3-mercaptopyruvate sulfurtransferase